MSIQEKYDLPEHKTQDLSSVMMRRKPLPVQPDAYLPLPIWVKYRKPRQVWHKRFLTAFHELTYIDSQPNNIFSKLARKVRSLIGR